MGKKNENKKSSVDETADDNIVRAAEMLEQTYSWEDVEHLRDAATTSEQSWRSRVSAEVNARREKREAVTPQTAIIRLLTEIRDRLPAPQKVAGFQPPALSVGPAKQSHAEESTELEVPPTARPEGS